MSTEEDLWCWWCCHGFDWEPLGFPYKYDDMRDRFYTTGRFCSFECVKAYNLDRDSATKGTNAMWILLMKKRLRKSTSPIRCAPKRQALRQFGGTMGIDEFRHSNTPVTVRLPNEIRQHHEVLWTSSASAPAAAASSSSSAPGELVLRRPKPLKRELSTLEKSLGITTTKR